MNEYVWANQEYTQWNRLLASMHNIIFSFKHSVGFFFLSFSLHFSSRIEALLCQYVYLSTIYTVCNRVDASSCVWLLFFFLVCLPLPVFSLSPPLLLLSLPSFDAVSVLCQSNLLWHDIPKSVFKRHLCTEMCFKCVPKERMFTLCTDVNV